MRDEEVVGRVIAGETALFEILMRRYNQRLFRVARGIVHADADAEDVVQQAYVSAYVNLAQFGGAAAFSTWLTRIVINEALGRTRKRTRLAEVELEEPEVTRIKSQIATPEDQVSRRETGAILEAAGERQGAAASREGDAARVAGLGDRALGGRDVPIHERALRSPGRDGAGEASSVETGLTAISGRRRGT
jgi:RNA polymerase sigma factor (sigma-70 family)